MTLQPVLDMSWGPAIALLGFFAFPFVAGWTLLSESAALSWLGFSQSLWRCLHVAVIINLVSGVAGLFTFNLLTYMPFILWVNSLAGSPPIDTYQTISSRTIALAVWLLLPVHWIGSILLEGLVLMALQWFTVEKAFAPGIGNVQIPFRNRLAAHAQAWRISAIVNTVSYLGFAIALLFFVRF